MTKPEIAAQIAQIETLIASYKRGNGHSLTALKAAHRKLYRQYLAA